MADSSSGGKQGWLAAVAVIVPVVVAAIGAYATIRAAQEGRQSGGATAAAQLQPTINIVRTQQAAPTQAPQVIEVTSPPVTVVVTSPPVTVVVTSPPVVVTSPPQVVTATPPPPTLTPDTTPPGSILDVEQTWKQGGTEMSLARVKIEPERIILYLDIINKKDSDISIQLTPKDNILAFDNQGHKLKTCFSYNFCETDSTEKDVVPQGQKITSLPYIVVDTTPQTITEVILKIVNVSTIPEAQWRIPITH